jgi:3-hydroxyacyl-CoA dehydrogenase
MNALDPDSLAMIAKSTKIVEADYKGLVIANDGTNFCAGANIGLALFAANVAAFGMLKDFIKQGQDTYMGLKYAPFPVVTAPSGLALGGGCEILLHSDAVQAHTETYTGLVEVGVGLIPGWGGCKEMVYRQLAKRAKSDSIAAKVGGMFSFISPVRTLNTMPALQPAFINISTAKVAKSAEQAQDMLILNDKSRITMNRARLLPDAKALCLELAENYTPPETHSIQLPGGTARAAFNMAVSSFAKQGKATPHDVVVSTAVGYVLSGGETDITGEVTEQDMLDLEREQFDGLLRNDDTLARIEHMLTTGKPLRN